MLAPATRCSAGSMAAKAETRRRRRRRSGAAPAWCGESSTAALAARASSATPAGSSRRVGRGLRVARDQLGQRVDGGGPGRGRAVVGAVRRSGAPGRDRRRSSPRSAAAAGARARDATAGGPRWCRRGRSSQRRAGCGQVAANPRCRRRSATSSIGHHVIAALSALAGVGCEAAGHPGDDRRVGPAAVLVDPLAERVDGVEVERGLLAGLAQRRGDRRPRGCRGRRPARPRCHPRGSRPRGAAAAPACRR